MPKLRYLLVVLTLVGCAHQSARYADTTTLAGLQAMANPRINKSQAKGKASMGRIREMALREMALSVGAQAGLAWQARVIDDQLTEQARRLDSIFDFNALILEHNILPPVLLEGRSTWNQANDHTIRISDRVYKLAKQARFITTPPNWRQYLWMDYKKPDMPHISLLPKTSLEREVWCYYVEKGWQNGIEQAGVILEESIARIKEDFKGMILYRKLLAMNMVSPPYVSHTDLGVTGDGEEMHIDDRVLRITALPALNIDSKAWIAAVIKDEDALKKFRSMEKLVHETQITTTSRAWQPVIAMDD